MRSFFIPSTSAARQADFFIHNVSLEAGDLPPVLDVEKKPESRQQFRHDVLSWLQTVEKYYGVRPIIYTSDRFLKAYLSGPEFESYPLWIAHYYVDYPESDMEWKFWPRGCAMAETLWCGESKPGYEDFFRRMKPIRREMIAEYVNCARLSKPVGRQEQKAVDQSQAEGWRAFMPDL